MSAQNGEKQIGADEGEYKNIIDRLLESNYENIPVDEDVKWCVFSFFNAFDEKMDEFKHHAKSEKRLNYQLMKRFIFTAYNNLVELDQAISRGKVYKPNRDMRMMQGIYNELQLFSAKPIAVSYERLFLRKQKSYLEVKESVDLMLAKMEMAKSRATSLKAQMNRYQDHMKLLDGKSDEFLAMEKEYKKCNGQYVDNLHLISVIKEQREVLQNKIKQFEIENLEIFSAEFYDILNRTVDSMNEILDGLAYEFDTLLWEEARNSDVIRKFFAESKIQGSFSSKTFLKYYLKSVDEEQARGHNKELFNLLSYLESVSTKHIFILGSDSDETQGLRYAVESIDKDYIVTSAISSDRVFVEHQRRDINLLILEYRLKGTTCREFLNELWKRFPETKNEMAILILFDHATFDEVDEMGFAGVNYFLHKSRIFDEIGEKIRTII